MRILVAEDDPSCRTLMAEVLADPAHDLTVVADGLQALAALSREPHDIALLDWRMPGMDGVAVCGLVRERGLQTYLHVILVSGVSDSDDRAMGLDAGAADYLQKPFQAAELRARVRSGERMVELHRRLCTANQHLQELALTDDLTHLPNRRAILQHVEEEVSRSERERGPLSLMLADLDRFKGANDIHGHSAGDAILREFARRLRANLRPGERAGRFGGDEFLLLLPGATEEQARAMGERLRRAVAEAPFALEDASWLRMTASLGVAQWQPGSSVADLLARTDRALYRSKRRGRDRVSTFAGSRARARR